MTEHAQNHLLLMPVNCTLTHLTRLWLDGPLPISLSHQLHPCLRDSAELHCSNHFPPFHALGPRASCSLVLDPGPLISFLPQPPRLLSHAQSRPHLPQQGPVSVGADAEASPPHRLLLLARHLGAKPSALSPAVRAPAHLPLPCLSHLILPLLLRVLSAAMQTTCLSPHLPGSLSPHIFPSASHPLLSLPSSDQFPFLLGACKDHQDCCLKASVSSSLVLVTRLSFCIRKWAERG